MSENKAIATVAEARQEPPGSNGPPGRIEVAVQFLQREVSEVRGDVRVVAGKLEGVDNRLVRLETRFESLETTVHRHGTRLDAIDTSIRQGMARILWVIALFGLTATLKLLWPTIFPG